MAPDGASGPSGRARAEPAGADVMAAWNVSAIASGLPRVQAWTPQRQRHLQARCRGHPERQDPAWWAALFQQVATSGFLTGGGPRGWRATLDWLLRSEDHVVRVLEGTYADRPPPAPNGASRAAAGEPRGFAGIREYLRLHAEEEPP